jgi:hypothetical protein
MLNEEKRKELIEKYGPLGEWTAPEFPGRQFSGETVVVKKPPSSDYRAFVAKVAKDASNKEAAIRDLVRVCVVFPDASTAEQIFDEYPAATLELSGAVTELAGGGGDGARIRKN